MLVSVQRRLECGRSHAFDAAEDRLSLDLQDTKKRRGRTSEDRVALRRVVEQVRRLLTTQVAKASNLTSGTYPLGD